MTCFYTEGDMYRFPKEDNEENCNIIEFIIVADMAFRWAHNKNLKSQEVFE